MLKICVFLADKIRLEVGTNRLFVASFYVAFLMKICISLLNFAYAIIENWPS